MGRGKGLKKVSFRGGGFFTCCALLLWFSSLLVSSSKRALAALPCIALQSPRPRLGVKKGCRKERGGESPVPGKISERLNKKKSPEGGGLVTVRTKRSSLHLLRTRPRRYCLSPLLSSPPPSLNRESLFPPSSFSYSIPPPFLEALQRRERPLFHSRPTQPPPPTVAY